MRIYPKFRSDSECAFPERNNCNYDEFDINKPRCPYMKCKSIGVWYCNYAIKDKLMGSIHKQNKTV